MATEALSPPLITARAGRAPQLNCKITQPLLTQPLLLALQLLVLILKQLTRGPAKRLSAVTGFSMRFPRLRWVCYGGWRHRRRLALIRPLPDRSHWRMAARQC
jgi:hypothetical protein